MKGNLLLPHCGISPAMRGRLRKQVNYVIHCAASIIFNEHVHTLLANNYEVTFSDLSGMAVRSGCSCAIYNSGPFLGQQPALIWGRTAWEHCSCKHRSLH
jgi:hypothetical protein